MLLFQRLLGTLAVRELDPADEAAMRRLSRLVPGEFRVVRDRFALRSAAGCWSSLYSISTRCSRPSGPSYGSTAAITPRRVRTVANSPGRGNGGSWFAVIGTPTPREQDPSRLKPPSAGAGGYDSSRAPLLRDVSSHIP